MRKQSTRRVGIRVSPFLNRVLDDNALDCDRLVLPKTMHPIICLCFGGVVPSEIQTKRKKGGLMRTEGGRKQVISDLLDNAVGAGQVQATKTRG